MTINTNTPMTMPTITPESGPDPGVVGGLGVVEPKKQMYVTIVKAFSFNLITHTKPLIYACNGCILTHIKMSKLLTLPLQYQECILTLTKKV